MTIHLLPEQMGQKKTLIKVVCNKGEELYSGLNVGTRNYKQASYESMEIIIQATPYFSVMYRVCAHLWQSELLMNLRY